MNIQRKKGDLKDSCVLFIVTVTVSFNAVWLLTVTKVISILLSRSFKVYHDSQFQKVSTGERGLDVHKIPFASAF